MARIPPSIDRRTDRPPAARVSTLGRLLGVWLVGLAGLAAVSLQTAVPVESLLLDPAVVGGGHWYSGLVTSMVVLGWSVASASAALAAYACHVAGRTNASQTMRSLSLIIAVLLFDDLFQLHSAVVPGLVGGTKWTLIVLEGIAVLLWVAQWRVEIVRTRWELLVAAGMGFAASLAVDRFPLSDGRSSLLAEDGAKVLAVLALATWAVSTAIDLIRSLADGGPMGSDDGRSTERPGGRREPHGDRRDTVA